MEAIMNFYPGDSDDQIEEQEQAGSTDLDRDEGQTNNGTIGGTGSDLDEATERLGGTPLQADSESK